MKISITTTNFQKDFVLPTDTFVGITLILENMSLNIIQIKNYSSEKYEEIILEDNIKIVLHYYNSFKVKEILEEFKKYDSIKCIEVYNPKIAVIASI